MQKLLYLCLCSILIFTITTVDGHAVTIAVEPVSQVVTVGGSAHVELVISGLGGNAAPSLGVFDLDFLFDPSIMTFSTASFGNQLDLFGFGSVTAVDASTPGVVNLFELSLDSASDLNNMQAGSFKLSELWFDTFSIGNAVFNVSMNNIGDADGEPIDEVNIVGGRISSVPLPAPFLLLLYGIVGLVIIRGKKFIGVA